MRGPHILELSLSTFHSTLAAYAWGSLLLSQASIPSMKANR
jgi:hypothetical protein